MQKPEPAATKGTLSDFRLIKSRRVCQLIIEIPIEEGDRALETLGGLPQPAAERWVAIAALNVTSIKPKEKRRFDDLKSTQQAAIRCAEPAFQRFLAETNPDFFRSCSAGICDEESAAAFVRWYCGVSSRSVLNLDTNAAIKWDELEAAFQLWMHEPAHA